MLEEEIEKLKPYFENPAISNDFLRGFAMCLKIIETRSITLHSGLYTHPEGKVGSITHEHFMEPFNLL